MIENQNIKKKRCSIPTVEFHSTYSTFYSLHVRILKCVCFSSLEYEMVSTQLIKWVDWITNRELIGAMNEKCTKFCYKICVRSYIFFFKKNRTFYFEFFSLFFFESYNLTLKYFIEKIPSNKKKIIQSKVFNSKIG